MLLVFFLTHFEYGLCIETSRMQNELKDTSSIDLLKFGTNCNK